MFKNNLNKLVERMKESNIDLAIITDDDSLYYFTGYHDFLHMDFNRPTILLVSKDGESTLITPLLDVLLVPDDTPVGKIGAYGSEVVRGGVLAVGKEQHEASLALNYSPYKRYRHVIIPQAIPVMIPTFGNLLIELLKLTAVASLITISDLTFMAHIIRVQTALTLEPFLVILVIYFIIASILVKIVDIIANKFSRGRNIMIAGEN